MRHRSLVIAAAAFLAGGLVSAGAPESLRPAIYVIDYMKVAPGGDGEYRRLEQELWKPVHAARIRSGQMRAWSLYEVRYPAGSARPYDYVTVNVFDSFEDAERDAYLSFREVYPDASIDAVDARTRAARELVRGELWYRLDHLE